MSLFCFFRQKTAYEMRIRDWSSDVCSSDLDSRTQDYHDFGLRGQLLFTPTDNFKLRLIGDYGFQKQQTAAAVLTGVIRTYDNGVNFANNYTDRTARLGVPVVADAPGERIVDMDGIPDTRCASAACPPSRTSPCRDIP